jgi:hypothetical protein
VENRAGIYFDFNPVLLTNTVWQTLRNPDPPVLVISPAGQAKTNLPRIYSNPMTERAMVCWDGLPAGLLNGYSLELTDLTGRVVWREQTVRNPAIIEKTDQPAGLYLLKISDRTGPAGVLKLIIR